MQDIEERACSQRFFRGLLQTLQWPQQQWPRMLLIKLSEFNFQTLPECVRTRLVWCFSSLGTTWPSECLFKKLRGAEDSTGNGYQSRAQRWFRASASDLLDDFDCPEVVPERSKVDKGHIPANFFEPESTACSLDGSLLSRILGEDSYPSPQTTNVAHHAWMAALAHKDSLDDLQGSWLSKLIPPGSIIRYPGGGGFVLESTGSGIVSWKLTPLSVGRHKVLTLDIAKQHAWEFKVFHDLSLPWKVVWYKVMTPRAFSIMCKEEGVKMAKRIALKLDGTPTGVLEFGARNAFAWVDGPTLQRLWTRLGLPTPRPTAVLDLCAGLIQSVLPGITDEELQLFLQKRDLDTSAVNFDTQSELLKEDPENLNGVWDEDDEDDIRKDLKEAKAKAARASASRSSRSSSERAAPPAAATEAQAPVAASSSASASSSSAAPPSEGPPAKQRVALPLGASELRKEDLHPFLPPNCTLTAERVWHSRWRLRYVGSTGTQATSKTFGGAVTEADALRYLLTTAWRWHQQDGGGECPWDFDTFELNAP